MLTANGYTDSEPLRGRRDHRQLYGDYTGATSVMKGADLGRIAGRRAAAKVRREFLRVGRKIPEVVSACAGTNERALNRPTCRVHVKDFAGDEACVLGREKQAGAGNAAPRPRATRIRRRAGARKSRVMLESDRSRRDRVGGSIRRPRPRAPETREGVHPGFDTHRQRCRRRPARCGSNPGAALPPFFPPLIPCDSRPVAVTAHHPHRGLAAEKRAFQVDAETVPVRLPQ